MCVLEGDVTVPSYWEPLTLDRPKGVKGEAHTNKGRLEKGKIVIFLLQCHGTFGTLSPSTHAPVPLHSPVHEGTNTQYIDIY